MKGLVVSFILLLGALIAPSITSARVVDSVSVAGPVNYGAPFTATYSTNTSDPWVLARCVANDTTILGDPSNAPPDGSIWGAWFKADDQHFVLGSSVAPYWLGGGADCTIGLYKLTGKYLGAQGFEHQTLLAESYFTAIP